MKLIITLLLSMFMFTGVAKATGKLIVEPQWSAKYEKQAIKAGLSIHEKIAGPLYFEGYTGVANKFEKSFDLDEIKYANISAGIGAQLGRLALEGGAHLHLDDKWTEADKLLYAKLKFELW